MAKTATATSPIERGMSRGGSRASSARFETVSIPVYAIIAIGIARKNALHVGATPQWMFAEKTTCGLKMSTKPSSTSRSCVAKSMTASRMFSRAASLIADDVERDEDDDHDARRRRCPTGSARSGSQKIER